MTGGCNAVAERAFEWRSAERAPALGPDQIHLWMAMPEAMRMMFETPRCRLMLSGRERRRAARIADPVKQRLYVAGRAGCRVLLEHYTGVDNAELEFVCGPRGKPELRHSARYDGLKFNYTVSAGHVLYGFARNRNLGVDMEVFPRPVAAGRFAGRILTTREAWSWAGVPADQANHAMLCCWTRKEAYGKLLGVGIRYAMNRVTLFSDLHRDHWHTGTAGSFEGGNPVPDGRLCGIQVGLPVAGTAALMFERGAAQPEFRTLTPSRLFWGRPGG